MFFYRGSMPPNPPSKRVASRARAAWRHANTPTFTKIFWTPPRNEILDTPLLTTQPWINHVHKK